MARAKFTNLVSGNTPSMLDAEVANEVIDACAAFESMTVSPEGTGSLVVNGRKAVLDLNGIARGNLVLTLCKNGVATDYNLFGSEV